MTESDKHDHHSENHHTVSKQAKAKENNSWIVWTLIIGVVVIAALIFYLVKNPYGEPKIVANDTVVSVNYIGKLENGTLFDTSDVDAAKAAGIYNPQRDYEPLTFTIGQGQMIKGFEQGVLGMRKGEKKTLTIKPEDAYGSYDNKNLEVVPRVDTINKSQQIDRNLNVTITDFKQVFNQDPNVSGEYSAPQSLWNYTVVNIIEDRVFLRIAAKAGQIIQNPQLPWKSTIIGLDNDKIYIMHLATIGQVIPTSLGNATIDTFGDKILIVLQPVKGSTIVTQFGQEVRVKDFNQTDVIIDMNHPLAGKTLKFDIEVVNITRAA